MTHRRPRFAPAAASFLVPALLSALPGVALAQQQHVRGSVRDGGSGAPVHGAMVVLLAADDAALARSLSGPDGAFQIAVPAAGRYRLRVDRIGYASATTSAFDVAPGELVVRDVTADVRPVEISGLDVRGARRCEVRPAEGLATARVWEEARKALEAAEWTAEREVYRFSWMVYQRELGPDGERVLDERRSHRRHFARRPFAALDPETLAREGFAREAGGDVVYYAPDATVLLSDAFLDTHCLALERATRDGAAMVGLRFEPVRGRDLPDVAGVVWLDEESGRLRALEYRYVNLPPRMGGEDAGGELAFRGLPNGTWIVHEWRIRMPHVEALVNEHGDAVRHRVLGFKDEGGVVTEVTTATGDVVEGGVPGGTVEGTVVDSLGRPAAGARVRVRGSGLESVTGGDGAFRFDDVGPGTWTVEAAHPVLVAVGHPGSLVDVEVERGEVRTALLELPSVRRVALERCAATPPDEDEAVVIGRVVDAEGAPGAGAAVRALWVDYEAVLPGRYREKRQGAGTEADEDGRFVVCGVPADHVVFLTASAGELAADTVEVRVGSADEVLRVDLALEPPERGPEDSRGGEAPGPADLPEADASWLAATGFWLRRDDALLHVTGGDVAREGLDSLPQVLALAPRVEVLSLPTGSATLRLHPAGAEGGAPCGLDLYVNGALARQRVFGPPLERSLSRLVDTRDLTAVEVFEASRAPVGEPDGCGAVLLWIREPRRYGLPPADPSAFTGTVRGRVVRAGSAEPLPLADVRVVLTPGGADRVTDADGRFDFGRVPPARYRVDVVLPGGTWSTGVLLRARGEADVVVEVEGVRR